MRGKKMDLEACGHLFVDGDYSAKCGELSLYGYIDICGLCREKNKGMKNK